MCLKRNPARRQNRPMPGMDDRLYGFCLFAVFKQLPVSCPKNKFKNVIWGHRSRRVFGLAADNCLSVL